MFSVRQFKKNKWGVFASVNSDLPIHEFDKPQDATRCADEMNDTIIHAIVELKIKQRAQVSRKGKRESNFYN